MHFICIYLLALLHIFEYTKKTELYPAIGKEELFQMLYSKNKKTRLHARGADRRAGDSGDPRGAAHSGTDRIY